MALTIRSVLEVGKLASPLIGGVIRLLGPKRSGTIRTAVAVEDALNRNPKKLTGVIVVLLIALAQWLFPEQADMVIEWIKVNGPAILEAIVQEAPQGG